MRLPKSLANQPLVEITFELRFNPGNQPVPEILPGLVFASLRSKYPRSETLPLASVPADIRKQDRNLLYQAVNRLRGERVAILVGDRVLGYSRTSPYPGWEIFKADLAEALTVARASGFLEKVERYSLKATNVVPGSAGEQLGTLRLRTMIGEEKVPETGFNLRMELNDERYVRIVQVATNVNAQFGGEKPISGVLVAVDCIRTKGAEHFWSNISAALDEIHDETKQQFFALLTETTIERLHPTY